MDLTDYDAVEVFDKARKERLGAIAPQTKNRVINPTAPSKISSKLKGKNIEVKVLIGDDPNQECVIVPLTSQRKKARALFTKLNKDEIKGFLAMFPQKTNSK